MFIASESDEWMEMALGTGHLHYELLEFNLISFLLVLLEKRY